MEKLTVTVEEMANMLGICEPKAYELVNREDFPSFRLGRRWVIPKVGLEQWLLEQASPS